MKRMKGSSSSISQCETSLLIIVNLLIISSLAVSVFNYKRIPSYPIRHRWRYNYLEDRTKFGNQIILNDRRGRSVIAITIKDGELYSIRNTENGLYLTSKSGSGSPGPVLSRMWANTPGQLWETTLLTPSKGNSLKPLENEFNSVTSQLVNNAHAYHAWEFQKVDKANKPNSWMIYTVVKTNKMCIESKGYAQPVEMTNCNLENPGQLWEIINVD